jgi:hypothetical protein
MTRLAALTAIALASCAAGAPRTPRAPEAHASAPALLSRAEEAASRSDHGRASAYYEAALDAGVDERLVLPRLVASLVRAGELRRALAPITRMRDLCPDDASYESLESVIRALLEDRGAAAGNDRVLR